MNNRKIYKQSFELEACTFLSACFGLLFVLLFLYILLLLPYTVFVQYDDIFCQDQDAKKALESKTLKHRGRSLTN